MARAIVMTSGKGGVGKTTVTANLGMHLSKKNFRVCLLDMDIGLNNLDVVMNMEDRVVYSITDVIDGRCRLREALVQDDTYPLLYLLSCGSLGQNLTITISQIKEVVNELHSIFDFILIDCPAGIDAGFKRAVSIADEALVVTTPHLSSIKDADKVVSILSSFNINSKRFVINRARGDLILNGEMLSLKSIKEFLRLELIGVVPEDDEIAFQAYSGGFLNCTSSVGVAIDLIAKNIATGSKNIYDCTKKYKGILGKIRKHLRKRV